MGNHSSATEFCLLGFHGSQKLHHILFTIFFFFYSVTVMGNLVIIMIVCVDKHLHSPMYFFLIHLSVLETLTTTIVVPVMLWGLLQPGIQTISLAACVAQLFLYLAVGATEFALLGAMAVDRYVAVCNPLRYNIIMNSRTCTWVVSACWVFGFLSEIWPVYTTFQFTFCKSNVLDHFFCDRGQLLKLSCDDTVFTESIFFLMAIFIIVGSLIPTIVSYTYIISTILKIPSTSGWRKAFSTCASHFTFVVIGYGTCFFLYMKPKQTQAAEYSKIVSLLISVVTPFLNPFIFTLRNDKVKEALGNEVKCCCQLLKDLLFSERECAVDELGNPSSPDSDGILLAHTLSTLQANDVLRARPRPHSAQGACTVQMCPEEEPSGSDQLKERRT
ncbi:olfactory receptor 9A4-like [Elephas maximus indicus]|uniref:olfactory receptor 9A4-like n=1 Tax=Elephas maximus indicus TaxID=99487 RepID=UPI002115DAD7|nr:olfactory receptor 9A4-like [Elephas maximus indicus]